MFKDLLQWACLLLLIAITYVAAREKGRLISQFRQIPSGVPDYMYTCVNQDTLICAKDLQGYHNCVKDEWDDYILGPITPCPEGFRCGCQLDSACHLSIADICIPTVKPYSMPGKATFYFTGYTIFLYNGNWPRDYRTQKPLWGFVKQDVQQGRYLQIVTSQEFPYKTFELIVPDGEGSYTKYSGGPKFCRKTTGTTFKQLGYDIKNYHREESKPVTERSNREKWVFKVGFDGIVWVDESWKWTVLADATKKISLPEKSYYFEKGDGPIYKQYAYWSVFDFNTPLSKHHKWYKMVKGGDWFSIPELCK